MNESPEGGGWVDEALAAQREHEKRSQSCMRQVGRAHVFRKFGSLRGTVWEACIVCDVTASQADYDNRREASTA